MMTKTIAMRMMAPRIRVLTSCMMPLSRLTTGSLLFSSHALSMWWRRPASAGGALVGPGPAGVRGGGARRGGCGRAGDHGRGARELCDLQPVDPLDHDELVGDEAAGAP